MLKISLLIKVMISESNKNLTINANRILTKPMNYDNSPKMNDSNKISEYKKEVQQFLNQDSTLKANIGHTAFKTGDSSYNQEKFNQANGGRSMISKPAIYEAAGTYNAAHLKRSIGIAPKDNVDFVPSVAPEMSPVYNSSKRINQNSSMPNLNDPSYHRTKHMNTFGFDTVTGVRKDASYHHL